MLREKNKSNKNKDAALSFIPYDTDAIIRTRNILPLPHASLSGWPPQSLVHQKRQ